MSLKLISINIEGHKHLGRVIKFLLAEKPDVVCLQEIFEIDVHVIEQALGMTGQFSSMATVDHVDRHMSHALGKWGVAQFTALPLKQFQEEYYVGSPEVLPIFMDQDNPNSMNRVLMSSTVEKEGQEFTIGTTHFTWSWEGKLTEEQQRDFSALCRILDGHPELIMCGDLNSPRQGEQNNVFNQLAQRFTDNIPVEVTTSIDGQFHKAGQLELMVDSMFSTPEYQIMNVRVEGGVSDHKAVIGEVVKR